MKKYMLLLLAILCVSLTGCGNYKFNETTAVQLTQEYMKEKYEKEIKDISTKIYSHGGLHNIEVNFKIKDDVMDDTIYSAYVEIKQEDKKTHYIKSDNYMQKLITPLLMNSLTNIFNEHDYQDFSLYMIGVEQLDLEAGCFSSEYPLQLSSSSFEEIMKSETLFFRFEVFIPQSEYQSNVCSEIENLINDLIDDDIIWVYVAECSDSDYSKIKKSICQNDEIAIKDILQPNYDFGKRFLSYTEIKLNQPDMF